MNDRTDNKTDARTVDTAMTPDPETVHVDNTLAEAAARMRDRDVGLLFVVDGDQLVGTVTDRDVCCRAVAGFADPADTPVLDAMTRHIVFCRMDDDMDSALRAMEREGIRRLAVLNGDDELVGVVSLSDFAHAHPRPGAPTRTLDRIATPTPAAKTPRRGLPTGGRAVAAPPGVPGTYAGRPRLPRNSRVGRSVANGE